MNRLIVLMLVAGTLPVPAVAAQVLTVSYESSADLLTVTANDQDLQQLLTEVALKTGVDIRMDPAANKTINAKIKNKPLQTALQQLAKGTSHVFYFKNEPHKKLLVRMAVLPPGKHDSHNAQSLITDRGNAVLMRTSAKTTNPDTVQQRRQARHASLSPEKRAYLEQFALDVERNNQEKAMAHEKLQAEAEQDRRQHHDKSQARREAMKINDPERAERHRQRRAAALAELQQKLDSRPPRQ